MLELAPMNRLLPVVLLAQAALVYYAEWGERFPPVPDLSKFSKQEGSWLALSDDTVDDASKAQLQADQILSRTYFKQPGSTSPVSLFMAWFQTQAGGTRQPHSPQVCLPGSGFTPVLNDRVALKLGNQTMMVNRYVGLKHEQRALILYWYQSSRRAVASEWESKFWTIWDGLLYRRSDIALIRLVAWAQNDDYNGLTKQVEEFASQAYPDLVALAWPSTR